VIEKTTVTKNSFINLNLAPGGGTAISFMPIQVTAPVKKKK
jgi:hypothetical protein